MLDITTPYFDMYTMYMVKSNKSSVTSSKPIVLHQKTCPVCNRQLVNLYYSAQLEMYICKKCIDNLMKGD